MRHASVGHDNDSLREQIDGLPEDARSKALARLKEIETRFPGLNVRQGQTRAFKVTQTLVGMFIALLLLAWLSDDFGHSARSATAGRLSGYVVFLVGLILAIERMKVPTATLDRVCLAIAVASVTVAGRPNHPLWSRLDQVSGFWQGLVAGLGSGAIAILCAAAVRRVGNSLYAWRETRRAWLGGPVEMLVGDLRPLTRCYFTGLPPANPEVDGGLDPVQVRLEIRKAMLKAIDIDTIWFAYYYKRLLWTGRTWPDRSVAEWSDRVAHRVRTAMLPLVMSERRVDAILLHGSPELSGVLVDVLLDNPFDDVEMAKTYDWAPRRQRMSRAIASVGLAFAGLAIALVAILNSAVVKFLDTTGHVALSEGLAFSDELRAALFTAAIAIVGGALRRARPGSEQGNPTTLLSFVMGRNV
jgi:hypothetical protein